MKREIIERLAIDSAAGELNEDTEVLFRTYLAEHPEANRWAEGMVFVYEKTEAGIEEKICSCQRDIKEAPMKVEPLSSLNWRSVVRWAAVVVFAACIGAIVGRWSKSDTVPQRPRIVAAAPGFTGKRPLFNLGDVDGNFWRDKAVAMLNVKPHGIKDTFIQSQGLWERYRQYIKEKHHE